MCDAMFDKDLECFGITVLSNDIFLEYLWKGITGFDIQNKMIKGKNIEKDDRYLLSKVNSYNSPLLKITYPSTSLMSLLPDFLCHCCLHVSFILTAGFVKTGSLPNESLYTSQIDFI